MMWSTCSNCSCMPLIPTNSIGRQCIDRRHGGVSLIRTAENGGGRCIVRALVENSSSGNSSSFIKRMEQAWLICQQPGPVACSTCDSKGHVECKWCTGTGFFILGDNILCQVPSRNTSCVICAGKGSTSCADCKGTGFRAKWLEQPPPVHK